MPEARDDQRLTRKQIGRLIHMWIGVDGGYLGNFSYAKHDRFWIEVCDLDVDTNAFPGATRACFEGTLFKAVGVFALHSVSPRVQMCLCVVAFPHMPPARNGAVARRSGC